MRQWDWGFGECDTPKVGMEVGDRLPDRVEVGRIKGYFRLSTCLLTIWSVKLLGI